jgi:hypothetical protein
LLTTLIEAVRGLLRRRRRLPEWAEVIRVRAGL